MPFFSIIDGEGNDYMSIDVTDYTNRLNDLKTDFQEKFDSQTRAHERQKDILQSALKNLKLNAVLMTIKKRF